MKINNKSISIAFVIILAATVIISLAGILLMSRQPLVLQGQVEATEIRISGKLPGRVDSFLVQEGDWVKAGDTLVVINSPTIEAKYRQVNALEQVAQEQNKKIDAGTRRQIVATARQLWNKTQSDLALAKTTYQRIVTLYKDSVSPPSGVTRWKPCTKPPKPPNVPPTSNTRWPWTERRARTVPRPAAWWKRREAPSMKSPPSSSTPVSPLPKTAR